MENVEIILYVKSLINSLDEDGFFDKSVNPFIDKDSLYDVLYKKVTNKVKLNDFYILSDYEFDECVRETIKKNVDLTIDDMLDNDTIYMSGINKDGEIIYSLKK